MTISGYTFVRNVYQLCNAGCRVTRQTINIGLPFFLVSLSSFPLIGLTLSPMPFHSREGLISVIVLSINHYVPHCGGFVYCDFGRVVEKKAPLENFGHQRAERERHLF